MNIIPFYVYLSCQYLVAVPFHVLDSFIIVVTFVQKCQCGESKCDAKPFIVSNNDNLLLN